MFITLIKELLLQLVSYSTYTNRLDSLSKENPTESVIWRITRYSNKRNEAEERIKMLCRILNVNPDDVIMNYHNNAEDIYRMLIEGMKESERHD